MSAPITLIFFRAKNSFFGKSGAKNEKAQATESSVARVKQQESVRKDFKQGKSLGSRPFFQREENCGFCNATCAT